MTPSHDSQVIGKYRLIAPIGKGGMAHVHLACLEGPLGFNKLFVIKRLREDVDASESDTLAMFLDEARLSARLSHPNIVQTVDVGEVEGRFFIAMEFLDGQSLRHVQRRLTPQGFPLAHQLRILSDVAKALHYAHELRGYDGEPLNVVHRDVSPQNVFITYDGQVKLLDFGIAKAESSSHLTQVGIIKGKTDYMAPEQMRGERVDHRADIFALGAMLYEALAQTRFSGGAKVPDAQKIHDRVTGREAPLRSVRPDVPESLARICDRAIALDPRARHATALEFALALDAELERVEPRPTPEALAELVQQAFSSERSQLRRLIDERMLIAGEATASGLRGRRTSLLPVPQTNLSVTPPGSASFPGIPARVPSEPPAPLPVPHARLPGRARLLGIAAAALLTISVVSALLLAFGGREAAVRAAVAPAVSARVEIPAPPVQKAPAPRPAPALVRIEPPAVRAEPEPARTRPGSRERPSRRVRDAAPAPEPQVAAPAPEPTAPRHDEFEPGADFRGLAPARGKPVDLELEEDPYE